MTVFLLIANQLIHSAHIWFPCYTMNSCYGPRSLAITCNVSERLMEQPVFRQTVAGLLRAPEPCSQQLLPRPISRRACVVTKRTRDPGGFNFSASSKKTLHSYVTNSISIALSLHFAMARSTMCSTPQKVTHQTKWFVR